ncbi:MAG: hypothetical protein NT062_11055, partial [Proteobacteria bacterium]|nr:hypothetical protein [Pseudomonadota bacterium]
MRGLVVLVLLVGCHTDTGDDTTTPDGPATGDPELSVRWVLDKPVPGAVTSDLSLTSAQLGLARLAVVGDAGPGDPRTTRDNPMTLWDATHAAPVIEFSDAPPGLYSLVTLDLQGDGEELASFELLGQVTLGGVSRSFRVTDNEDLRISLPCNALVEERQPREIALRLRLDHALTAIDFTNVPMVNNVLVVDHDSDQIIKVRNELVD